MSGWSEISDRAVRGLGVKPRELVQVREHSGRHDVLLEMLLAVERVGATPLPELTPPEYLRRLLNEVDDDYLADWDRYRKQWMETVDRVLVLQGSGLDADEVPNLALDAWAQAVDRLTAVEDERRLPYMLVGVPTVEWAEDLDMSFEALEDLLLPAMAVPIEVLRQETERVLARVRGGKSLLIRSGNGAELRLDLANRRWLTDDGWIETEDRLNGAHASNLPAGSVYTTCVETSAEGSLFLPDAVGAVDVMLHFRAGDLVQVDASHGADFFGGLLERHVGDRDRIGCVTIGLNPELRTFIGWPIVDKHVYGAVSVTLGENRQWGGKNESTLTIDFPIANATLLVDDELIVDEGRVVT